MHNQLKPGSSFHEFLMGLHTARRILITEIEEANRQGKGVASLERDLSDNRTATRHFLAYLEGHV